MRLREGMMAMLLALPGFASGQSVVVYDDALQNGFLNFSFGAPAPDFANPAPVHAGAASIAFTGSNFNAIGLANVGTDYATATHPVVRFFVHGGASGGQQLRIFLQTTDGGGNSTALASGELDGYITGGAIVAGQWREVLVNLTQPPLSYNGSYDRIDLQSDVAGAQPVMYVDTISLEPPANPGGNAIFANGFEGDGGGPAVPLLLVETNVAVGGMQSERYTWRDADNQPRVAALARNDGQVGPQGQRGGELWEYRYEVPGGTRIVRQTGSFAGGFGYVVSHRNEGTTGIGGNDDSPLGHGFSGQFLSVFAGRHHAILRFTQRYPRYSRTDAVPPNTQYQVPVTIEWMIANGRSHPLWAMTWDLTGALPNAVPADALNDDTRAPYGEMLFDGAASAGAHSVVAGVGWGDRYQFVSTTNPVTLGSEWTWNQPNTIPYVKLWTSAVDATMGTVQTQTIVQQDAGGYFGTNRWNSTSAAGLACTVFGNNYRMPCDFNWPYQSINYSLGGGGATNNTRLAWGSNFGWLGQQAYFTHGSAFWGGPLPNTTASGWPRKSYATFVVLDRHSEDPVGAQVAEIETVQTTTASAAVGSVRTSGPAGVARPDSVTYAPAGWNHVRAAWAFDAAGNQLDANLAVANGALRRPLLIVSNWTAALPAGIRFNGQTLVQDVDYLPSLRADTNELWITLLRDLQGATNRVQVP
ncbi:MAG: hypothetical protein IPK27_00205 [Rhodanobacteraceae bacterium]|nr:hypothetical protein [Rhodanobacteraceae bacterium]